MKKNLLYYTLILVASAFLLTSCNGNTGQSATSSTQSKNGAGSYEKNCPDTFSVKLETTKGDIIIDVKKEWAPLGAQRFWELVNEGYYTDVAFFRVIRDFIAQTGIHGDPATNEKWRDNKIQDDPVKQGNEKGTVVFAMGGPNTRTTQIFINLKNNNQLDEMGFSAFGKVREMDVATQLYDGYGEGAPRGKGPSQMLIQTKGNSYLKPSFPQLDYIQRASILK